MRIRGNPRQVIENKRPGKTVGVSHQDRRKNEHRIKPDTLHRWVSINGFAESTQLEFFARTCSKRRAAHSAAAAPERRIRTLPESRLFGNFPLGIVNRFMRQSHQSWSLPSRACARDGNCALICSSVSSKMWACRCSCIWLGRSPLTARGLSTKTPKTGTSCGSLALPV
jgi:hypothetical protein